MTDAPEMAEMTGETTDEKYVVVKRGDVQFAPDGAMAFFHVDAILPDATVIRGQEIFASTALFSYANSILATIEVIEALGITPPSHLLVIADYFHRRGLAARSYPIHKIPDP